MRFFENGPSIPDELLTARDQGRVVFFCGAGVSRAKAGFADFFGLANSVINDLDVDTSSPVCKLLNAAKEITTITDVEGVVSADRIFGLLEREFSTGDIYKSVAKALTPKHGVDLSAHKTMLKLATTNDGFVRLVTTNFDYLFDLCEPKKQTFLPPKLPDLNHPNEFNGTIYLHGKVNEDGTGAASNGFVLSSSEFGEAYLANGWATSFVKEILEKYVVVFVGYSADDPPIQYLLEALNKNSKNLNEIYAFQSGDESYASSKWHHKGVKAIAYDDENGHIALWNTLEAWAERASNPDAWYQEIITKAKIGPRHLKPFERGQIAHIVSTTEGAKRFAHNEILAPATWLHVFDSKLRYEGPIKNSYVKENPIDTVDPFHSYCLDSDHTPQHVDPNDLYNKREVPTSAWDAFELNSQDIKGIQDQPSIRFRGDNSEFPQFSTLPQRLNALTDWLSKVAEQPEVIWWITKQQCIHPWVKFVLKSAFERRSQKMDSVLNQAWGYILDGFEQNDQIENCKWYKLEEEIENNGWCPRKLRQFEKITRPYIKVAPPSRTLSETNRDQISLKHLIRLDVHYSELPSGLKIPNEWIIRTVEILRRNLELAVELENEIEVYGLSLNFSLTPEENTKSSYNRTYGLSAWAFFFVSYLERLVLIDIDAAHKEFSKWPCDDSTLFAKLRIWALGKTNLVPNESICATLNQISDEAFWNDYNARDLLLAFKTRWKELDQCSRSIIENRILQGPKSWRNEDENGFKKRKVKNTLEKAVWLEQNGCQLTNETGKLVDRLKDDAPEWKPEYAKYAAYSFESRGGIVTKNPDHSGLTSVPLSSILDIASELSGRKNDFLIDNDPFLGLSQEKPIRAFRALICLAKKGDIVDWAWHTFLYAETCKDDNPRFIALIAERLYSFTNDDLAKILRPVSTWFNKSTSVLADNYSATCYKLAPKLVDIISIQPSKGNSSIGRGSKSPDWSMESINSPAGKITQIIMKLSHSRNFEPGECLTGDLLPLLNQLLALPNDLNRYAMVILSHDLSWFFSVDPDWTKKNLLSALDSPSREDRQAFWAGVFWRGVVYGKELFTILKPSILGLTYSGEVESRGQQDVIVRLIFSAWKIKNENERWVSNTELRQVLIQANDDFRCGILWQARHGGDKENGDWLLQFRELISDVWPKQLAAKSHTVSERLCSIAFSSEDHFSEIVTLITPLLTKLERAHHYIYGGRYNIPKKYPNDLLSLLDIILPDDVDKWFYNFENYLDKMIETDIELGKDERYIELKRKWDAR